MTLLIWLTCYSQAHLVIEEAEKTTIADGDNHINYLIAELKKAVDKQRTSAKTYGSEQAPSTSGSSAKPLTTNTIHRCMDL